MEEGPRKSLRYKDLRRLVASVNPFGELLSYFFAAVVKAVDPRGLKSVVLTTSVVNLPDDVTVEVSPLNKRAVIDCADSELEVTTLASVNLHLSR